jgi:hypothetical protein
MDPIYRKHYQNSSHFGIFASSVKAQCSFKQQGFKLSIARLPTSVIHLWPCFRSNKCITQEQNACLFSVEMTDVFPVIFPERDEILALLKAIKIYQTTQQQPGNNQ